MWHVDESKNERDARDETVVAASISVQQDYSLANKL